MDNLTHTVIGLVAGETLAQATRARRRVPLLVIGMVGGNLPDADLLASYGDGKLGYLLQHRGYTHTILGCIVLALLLYGAVVLGMRLARQHLEPREHRLFAAMALLAVFLHLGMDALNSYGVHPFWPWDDHWHYGDSIFIIEPWYWIAAAPLLFVLRSRVARAALGLLLLAALAANFVLHAAQPLWWLGVTAACVLLVLLGRRVSARLAASVSAVAMGVITVTFALAGRSASLAVEALARSSFPDETLLEHVLTPSPTTPLCWDVLLLQRDRERYIARHAVLALPPQRRALDCPRVFAGAATTAPWVPAHATDSAGVQWLGELALPLHELAELVAGNCEAQALMQFVRAPYALRREGRWIIGDLRFDREADLGLAELELVADPTRCPRAAPWVSPRAELLEAGGRGAGVRMEHAREQH